MFFPCPAKSGAMNKTALASPLAASLAWPSPRSPLPAQAQVVSASYRSPTKTEAILGGAPSALAAIIAQQQASGTPSPPAHSPPPRRAYSVRPRACRIYARRSPSRRSARRVQQRRAADRPQPARSRAGTRSRAAGVGGRAGALRRIASRSTAIAPSSKRSTATSTRASASSTTAASIGVADRWTAAVETLPAAAAIARIMRIAKLAMLRRAGFADQRPLPGRAQGSRPPRRPCRAGRPRRRPLPGARQRHRPDRSIARDRRIIGRS